MRTSVTGRGRAPRIEANSYTAISYRRGGRLNAEVERAVRTRDPPPADQSDHRAPLPGRTAQTSSAPAGRRRGPRISASRPLGSGMTIAPRASYPHLRMTNDHGASGETPAARPPPSHGALDNHPLPHRHGCAPGRDRPVPRRAARPGRGGSESSRQRRRGGDELTSSHVAVNSTPRTWRARFGLEQNEP
jgi:hypothetical protein